MAGKQETTFDESQAGPFDSSDPLSTRARLKSCYLELLAQQSMDEIKVTKLCSRAGIGRSTFYNYYRRMDDLIEDLFEDFFSQIDPSCCKFLKYENIAYQGGIPPCEFIRSHRAYLPLFMDDALSLYFANRATTRYMSDAEAWADEMKLPKKSAPGILAFLLNGCFFGAVRSIDLTDREWDLVRSLIDDAINYEMDKQRQAHSR